MADPRPQVFMFTYGTLKRDFTNYYLIQTLIDRNDAAFVGNCVTCSPYPMVIGPYGIAYLINLPDAAGAHPIKGELYSISSGGLSGLDELEALGSHYERLPIQIRLEAGGEEITAEAYFAHRSYGERLWKLMEDAALSEFTEKLDRGFVRKADRVGRCSLDEIESLLSGG